MINHKCWAGKAGKIDEEVDALVDLLKQVLRENINLILAPESIDEFDWLGQRSYLASSDVRFPNSGGHIALQTSGTTGTPKLVWKKYGDVLSSKRGHGSSKDVWLLAYNPARWAGLSVVIHALKTNSRLIAPQAFTPTALLDKIGLVTHISMTPSLFRKLIMTDYSALANASIKQVTFGGEYTTQKILDEARALWPAAKITHIYATTELGDVCACSDGREGFPVTKIKKPYVLQDGELIIDGVFTGDIWKIENDRLYFIGRKTEFINVGGAKVSQSYIENIVNQIEQVAECRAYALSNTLLGEVVGLDYVGEVSPLELRKKLLSLMPKYAVPVKFNQVDTIKLTHAGKMSRK